MAQVSKVLRKSMRGYCYYCPGCKDIHCIPVNVETRPNWSFDGNIEQPTFSPSVRHFTPAYTEDDGTVIPEQTFCHYHIIKGQIRYCGDCTHELNGKTVPLPELPEAYSDANYGWPP